MAMFLSVAVVKLKTKRKLKPSSDKVKISKKTTAEVIEKDGKLMAKVLVPNNHGDNDIFEINFTPESFKTRGKKILFTKNTDKNKGHSKYIAHHISPLGRMIPKNPDVYFVLRPNLIVSGYLVKISSVLYFDYDDEIVSFSKYKS